MLMCKDVHLFENCNVYRKQGTAVVAVFSKNSLVLKYVNEI